MATLKDVARRSGLSITQVSRALNNHSDVSAETRKRVQSIAKKLNYQPNIFARKLVSGRSGLVGLVVPGTPNLSSDGLFLEVVAGLSTCFSARRMHLVLHIAPETEAVSEVYERLIGNGALDGFVLINPKDDDPRPGLLEAAGVPFVVHGRIGTDPSHCYFDIDNEGIFYELTRHLIEQGHRRIAFLTGPKGFTFVTARDRGFRRAMAEAGLAVDESMIHYGQMTESMGLVSTIEMFSKGNAVPTALLTGSVKIAWGVYQALNALGLRIPADVSVVSHDDHLVHLQTEAFFPALTVSDAPLRESWQPLAECLIGAIEGADQARLQRIGHHRLILRHSVAAPRQGRLR
ncbi:MAG: LacI family DNA-binding transcriptional regulator [Paracoccus sp. (in: a-proteobacteria)]|uniref:LacI family DNA-binding transcriptional regulator n=1 Tax=Paracoccus sp. TaxID=267 RepID=UPI0039E4A663